MLYKGKFYDWISVLVIRLGTVLNLVSVYHCMTCRNENDYGGKHSELIVLELIAK
jgi:hypothetical protein